MWTGINALNNIDQTLQTIRNETVRLDTQISQLTNLVGENQRQRVRLINDIAGVRLHEIEHNEFQQSYTAADQYARQELQQRDLALAQLNLEIDETNRNIENQEQRRSQQLVKVNEISQNIVEIESQVQAYLQADETYLAQLEKARAADGVMNEARQKATQAETDLAAKAKPYQDDSLFMYLWAEGFGTTEYQGRLLTRVIDSWLARLIKYEPGRLNYWNLTEIPKRLSEHAERVSDVANTEHQALQTLELEQLQSQGAKALEGELSDQRSELDQHDDELEKLENALNSKLQERLRFTAGEDDYIQRCITRFTQVLDHQNIRAIQNYVLATSSPTDDQLVIELQGVEERLQSLQGDLSHVRLLHDKKLNKLVDLEKVRRKFKNSRYDDVRSGFGNKAILASVLNEFLRGAVSGNDLWRTIKRNQRYRNTGSSPDFGSGGLGSLGNILGGGAIGRRRSSSWHIPRPRGGGGGFKFPSGGGFKTGGGF